VAANTAAGAQARVEARSTARPFNAITPVFGPATDIPTDPVPAVVAQQTWDLGAIPASGSALTVKLTNVAQVVVDVLGAGFAPGQSGTLSVQSDGPAQVILHTSSGDVSVPPGATSFNFTA
jgi:hypothetical protein